MIVRRQFPHPGWRIEMPRWARRLQRVTTPLPRDADDASVAERTAKRSATMHRASGIRVEAERGFFGLTNR